MHAALGVSQLDYTVWSYLDPARFLAQPPVPDRRRSSLTVFLIALEELPAISALPIEHTLRSLPTYFQHNMFVRTGDPLPRTVDLNTCPGIVDLAGPEDRLQHDYACIRRAEVAGYM